jgi:hypothetical protein
MTRMRCWQMRQGSEGAFGISDHLGSPRRSAYTAKDVLGAVVSLAVIGVFILQATNRLAGPCNRKFGERTGSGTGPGTCSGMSAIANHAHEIVALCVIACTSMAAVAFVWYMIWGYKTQGRTRVRHD